MGSDQADLGGGLFVGLGRLPVLCRPPAAATRGAIKRQATTAPDSVTTAPTSQAGAERRDERVM